MLKVLFILAVIITALWFFPPTHKLIIDFYEQNQVIKTLVDILTRILQGLGNSIVTFFKNLV